MLGPDPELQWKMPTLVDDCTTHPTKLEAGVIEIQGFLVVAGAPQTTITEGASKE